MKHTASIWAASIAGVAYFISLLVGCVVVLTNHLLVTIDSAQPITANLSTASKAWADASKQQAQSTVAIERDVRAEMWHVDRTLTTLDGTLSAYGGIPAHLNGVADASTGLLASAKGTTDKIPDTLTALNGAIGKIGGTADQATVDMDDFDAVLKDQAIHRTAEDLAGMADSGNHIMFDFRRVADKETDDFLKPVKWYMQPVKKFGDIWDIGAAIARHTP